VRRLRQQPLTACVGFAVVTVLALAGRGPTATGGAHDARQPPPSPGVSLVAPLPGASGPLSGTATPAVPPTPDPSRPAAPPLVVPTPPGPAPQCRVGETVVAVPSVEPPAASPAPSEVSGFAQIPTAPGATWTPVASVEPLPSLVVELLLPAATFLMGEAISPQVRVQNAGQVPVAIYDPPRVEEIDQDTSSSAPTTASFLPGFWPETHPGPGVLTLQPGQTHIWSQTVQLPFANQPPAWAPYRLRAVAQLGAPVSTEKNMAAWPVFVTASVPLTLVPASPEQQLGVEWQTDRQQWCVQAADGDGGQPAGPLVAWMHATSARGATLGRLRGGTGDLWAGFWVPFLLEGGVPVHVSLWVAGPGYVTGLATATVPPAADWQPP